ncbi:energy-coupling factor transporter transmembrane component T [Clostridium aestuarii]|uniref:Energy-coupling factor transporter transmembrane component T n=1 Tax=Clostridium aestuarii TaxID=338193 RepID=A0ABT4CY19_9CLOT|nr:energy-coupling factor transporter transmembrane component T [Clostridium aestuarii]MCY6482845.1 energy-coupling factor transporter transmembrane component T [Clostridium aestuarii]
MLIYKKRNTFLQGLHPAAGISLLLIYLIAFLVIKNPIYLLIILASLVLLAVIDGCIYDLMEYAKLILPFVILVMILNPLIVHNGSTVLYKGHFNIPVLGTLRITLEAVMYGIFNGLRVISLTLVFGFANLIVNPDKSFSFFSKYLRKSALLMNMTIRLFPTLAKKYTHITEIERLRGNIVIDKNIKNKIKKQGNIVNILFLSSIEDAGDMAESMYSRGYGIGKRSVYFNMSLCLWDTVIILTSIFTAVYLKLFQMWGLNKMMFYPRVDNPINNLTFNGLMFTVLFFIPTVVNWGWKQWKY